MELPRANPPDKIQKKCGLRQPNLKQKPNQKPTVALKQQISHFTAKTTLYSSKIADDFSARLFHFGE